MKIGQSSLSNMQQYYSQQNRTHDQRHEKTDKNNSNSISLKGYGLKKEDMIGMHYHVITAITASSIRERIDQSINKIFKNAGITMPTGQEFTFRVNGYDNYIHVEGIDDSQLKSDIETALNVNDNGHVLFNHISYSKKSVVEGFIQPSDYNSEAISEIGKFHFVKELTGYDLRDMDIKDGTFYTKDNISIQSLFEQVEISKGSVFSENWSDVSSLILADLQKISNSGGLKYQNYSLMINYKDGHLYDRQETGYGPGQKGWIDIVEKKHKRTEEFFDLNKKANTAEEGKMNMTSYYSVLIGEGEQNIAQTAKHQKLLYFLNNLMDESDSETHKQSNSYNFTSQNLLDISIYGSTFSTTI